MYYKHIIMVATTIDSLKGSYIASIACFLAVNITRMFDLILY